MTEAEGYILRIATDEWVNQVFSIAAYFTSLLKKWQKGQIILFMHKTNVGDSVVGYGEVGDIYDTEELSAEEEKQQCNQYGWKKAIEFSYVMRFEKPLPIKDTFFKGSKLRGRCFHGYRLTPEQLKIILKQAEKLNR